MAGKGKLTTTDLDLIFSKYKTKGQKKLSYSEFLEALPACADKKVPPAPPPGTTHTHTFLHSPRTCSRQPINPPGRLTLAQ